MLLSACSFFYTWFYMRLSFQSDSDVSDLRNLLSVSILIIFINLIVFGYLWRNIQMSTLKYEINRLKKQKKQLYLETEELRFKVARFSRASRLEKLFKEKYGYVPVQVSQKITTLKLPKIKSSELTQIAPEKKLKDQTSDDKTVLH